jgi:hypothetical protein
MLYHVNKGLGLAGVLSKPFGARAGKISLPFSAERPIMKTGMPASFFLLLSADECEYGSESEISSRTSRGHFVEESDHHPKGRGVLLVSCLSPVRTFYVVKSDTERFGNVYTQVLRFVPAER